MTEQDFTNLLHQPESESLDFKRTSYNLSDESSKADLIKDVLCMANTPRENLSSIVLGVKKHPDGSCDLWGLTTHLDDADLQSQFSDRVHPIPAFSYEECQYQGKSFGIITVPPRRIGPCVPVKRLGNMLLERQVYFRRGSKNDLAMPEDLHRIVAWIAGGGMHSATAALATGPQAWDELIGAVYGFDPSRRYVLLATPFVGEDADALSVIGKIPTTFAFDLDPASDAEGLLKAVSPVIALQRSVHLVVLGDRPIVNSLRATYWFFARGLNGRAGTVESGPWKNWATRYVGELAEQLRRLASAISPTPVTCIALWYDVTLVRHLRSLLGSRDKEHSAQGHLGGAVDAGFLCRSYLVWPCRLGEEQFLRMDLSCSLSHRLSVRLEQRQRPVPG